jgi:THO complex subunit 2
MQEQDKLAAEEAEKRLKAALTAKREPSVTTSRVASPSPAVASDAADFKASAMESVAGDDVPMDIDSAAQGETPVQEVGFGGYSCRMFHRSVI